MTCNSFDYKFTKVPTKLFMCLDGNCRTTLFTLIQLSTMFGDEQGWFFRSNADIEAETGLSKKVLDGTLDALLQKGVIDFIPQQQGQGVKQTSRKYKVNYNSFLTYETLSMDDCIKNPEYKIFTSNYKASAFSWQGKEWAGKKASLSLGSSLAMISTSTHTLPQPQPNVPTNIDIINMKDSIISNINHSDYDKTATTGNGAEHSNYEYNKMKLPSDSIEPNNETKPYNPSSCNTSKPHDNCLKYIYKNAPSELTLPQHFEFTLAEHLFNLVKMDAGILPRNDKLFYEAREIYTNLYHVDVKQATKDINILKSRVAKMREEHNKSST